MKYPNFQGLPGYKDLTKDDQSSVLETLRTIDSSVTPDDKNFIDDAEGFDGNEGAGSISPDSSEDRVLLNRSKKNVQVSTTHRRKQESLAAQQPPRSAISRGADDTPKTSKPRSTSGGGNLGDAMRQPMSPEEQKKLKQDLILNNLESLIRMAQMIVDLAKPRQVAFSDGTSGPP